MISFGQELKSAREKAAISLADISKQTKITVRLLKAMEDDRFDLLPEPFFVRGMIRAYVKAVGGEENYFLALHAGKKAVPESDPEEIPKKREPALKPAPESRPGRDQRKAERDRRKAAKRIIRLRLPVLALLLILILTAAAVFIFLFLKAQPRPAPRISTPIPSITAPEKPKLPAAGLETTAPPVKEEGLRLEFRFQADAWMHVTADGVVVFEGIQQPGRTAEYRAATEFILQTGNAGGFTYTINGKPGKSLGLPGIVRIDVRINRETLAAFLQEPAGASPGR
jgi:cytoskeletal protein RodZ